MKYLTRTLALSLSLAAFSFMTSPAFAQDADSLSDKAVDMAKSKVKSMAKEKVSDAVENEMAADVMVDEGEKMVTDKMTHKEGPEKKDLMQTDTVKETGDIMRAPAVMQSPVKTPVQAIPADTKTDTNVETIRMACPAGTTAQDDGTCMITGDYSAE